MVQLLIFILISMTLIIISWTSLHHPDSHGFYRFFAWETILALVVINVSKLVQPLVGMVSNHLVDSC